VAILDLNFHRPAQLQAVAIKNPEKRFSESFAAECGWVKVRLCAMQVKENGQILGKIE
jgi:hypothetical protein